MPPAIAWSTWRMDMTVGGAYRIEEPIGKGGMGTVFRAVRIADDVRVALKLLTRAAMLRDESIARFRREAELAKRLKHESTIRVLDAGDAGDGTPFIAFELLEGISLDAMLAGGGRLTEDQALGITTALLGSLEEAHALGIVHRDVKPANVFLCSKPEGLVKLLDFGVAKSTAEADLALTAEGLMVGTPAYMSPEQISAKEVSASTDLYAVALVFAEMLTGKPIYDAQPLQICMDKVRGVPIPYPESLRSSRWFEVLERATRIMPALRFPSASEMRSALAQKGLRSQPVSQPDIELIRQAAASSQQPAEVGVPGGGTEILDAHYAPPDPGPRPAHSDKPAPAAEALDVTVNDCGEPPPAPALPFKPTVQEMPPPSLPRFQHDGDAPLVVAAEVPAPTKRSGPAQEVATRRSMVGFWVAALVAFLAVVAGFFVWRRLRRRR